MIHEENNQLLTKINEIYQKQLTVYQNVLKLAEEQMVLTNKNNEKEKVIKLINTRLQLLNSIEKSNLELNTLKSLVVNNLIISEFRIGLIKEKLKSAEVEQLSETLSILGRIIKNINEIDEEIRLFYTHPESKDTPKITNTNPQKVHQAYKVFIDGSREVMKKENE